MEDTNCLICGVCGISPWKRRRHFLLAYLIPALRNLAMTLANSCCSYVIRKDTSASSWYIFLARSLRIANFYKTDWTCGLLLGVYFSPVVLKIAWLVDCLYRIYRTDWYRSRDINGQCAALHPVVKSCISSLLDVYRPGGEDTIDRYFAIDVCSWCIFSVFVNYTFFHSNIIQNFFILSDRTSSLQSIINTICSPWPVHFVISFCKLINICSLGSHSHLLISWKIAQCWA